MRSDINRPERRKGSLSKERVVAAAIDNLDAEGESALTFRMLASRLSTGSGAIYWHVADKDALLSAATGPVGSTSPSSIGITLTKEGTITFDGSAFSAAMAKDPAGTTAMFQTIAGRVATAATAASDPYSGTLTTRITSEQSQEASLTTQISDWDSRLATIKANYQTQYNALETAMSNLSSQASYLTSQLSGLTTNYS